MKTINKKTLGTSAVLLAMVFGATSASALSFGDFTFFGGSNTSAETKSSAELRGDTSTQATSTNSRDQASTMLNASVGANGTVTTDNDNATAGANTSVEVDTDSSYDENASFFTRIGLWFKSMFSFNSNTDSTVEVK